MKQIFLKNSRTYLFFFFIISFLHTIFEFLALKNMIWHWKDAKDQTGISSKQYYFDCFYGIILIFY